MACMPGAPKPQIRLDDAEQSCDGGQASPLFSQSVLKHGLVQRRIRHQTSPLTVLILRLLQPPDLRHAHPGIDFLPSGKRHFRILIFLQISPTVVPASACAKANAISLSLNRFFGISDATYYNWRKRFGRMGRSQLSDMKNLENENTRLKEIVAELELELDKLNLKESLNHLKPTI